MLGALAFALMVGACGYSAHDPGDASAGDDASTADAGTAHDARTADEDAAAVCSAEAGCDGGAPGCTTDDACDDGRFCNGAERCEPTAAGASARGCVAGSPPCVGDSVCDEERDDCTPRECVEPELSRDGASSGESPAGKDEPSGWAIAVRHGDEHTVVASFRRHCDAILARAAFEVATCVYGSSGPIWPDDDQRTA